MQSSTTTFLFSATAPIVAAQRPPGSAAGPGSLSAGANLSEDFSLRLQGQPPRRFIYKDYGSLVSLSYSSVGNLMGIFSAR